MATISKGSMVQLAADPQRMGAVTDVIDGTTEKRYQVFMDNQLQTFYESQLILNDPELENQRIVSFEEFLLYLSSLQIRHPSCSTLYSLNAARIDFIPYQFRPALKFIRSERPRILIADGVGVGKTIEAGLILREMQARMNVQSVLIICPRPLITERKWELEMKRFDEDFTPLDGPSLRYCIRETENDGIWPAKYNKIIIPYSLMDEVLIGGKSGSRNRKSKKGLLELKPPPRFDLVIVDEAHHIRNPETYSHKVVSFFCVHAEAAVFLTATPIQLGNEDLFNLLHILWPDLILDKQSFHSMAEPNPFINQAVSQARAGNSDWQIQADEALQHASETSWGKTILSRNPEFITCRDSLKNTNISRDQRVEIIRRLEDLHTFAGIINRTRRRDIGEFTIRKPETISVDFTPSQQHVHDKLIEVQARILEALHGSQNVNFMLTTLRRQAASCIFGLAPFIEDILMRRIDELTWLSVADSEQLPEDDFLDSLRKEIDEVVEAAKRLPSDDPKLENLRRIIEDKQNLPNNKMILFSTFRHTLAYLYQKLTADGYRVGLVHGGTPYEERTVIRTRFEAPRDHPNTLDILLFSEVGCEGLDYQFCDCMVNYDIPWNPMRIEQRIGRIDRVGQQSETVAIYNFITPGTVDAEIYERCLQRIGVFNESIGESEEILGDINKEIRSIAECLELTPEQRQKKFEQLADNEIRLIQEKRQLEDKEAELFGIRLPKEMIETEVKNASNKWLTPEAIQCLVACYLRVRCGDEREYLLGEKSLKTLRLSEESRSRLLADYENIEKQISPMFREWELWLKGGDQHLPITFEAECAKRHKDAAFIMPVHPLAIQAAHHFQSEKPIFTTMTASCKEISPGRYPFAIYAWEYIGLRNDLEIRCISTNHELMDAFPRLLLKTDSCVYAPTRMPDDATQNELDTIHHQKWLEARREHRERSETIARARLESLTTSHNARLSLIQEQLSAATNEKIRRMKQSEINNAEADYEHRVKKLHNAGDKADIIAQSIAFGTIEILKGV